MVTDTNGEGFRITIGLLYGKIEEQNKTIDNLGVTVARMDERMNTVLQDNGKLMEKIQKQDEKYENRMTRIETRMNGALTGIGVGILTALVAVFRGVVG